LNISGYYNKSKIKMRREIMVNILNNSFLKVEGMAREDNAGMT